MGMLFWRKKWPKFSESLVGAQPSQGFDQARALYWDSKRPFASVTHKARPNAITGKKMPWDVRCFIQPYDALCVEILEQAGCDRDDPHDETAERLLAHVTGSLFYTGDAEANLGPEFWAFPRETWYAKKGDCEDGANLLVSCMIAAGIPRSFTRVACGSVDAGTGLPAGHAYACYCRQDDREWVVLDWCYWADKCSGPVAKLPLLKDRPEYRDTWFSYNDLNSWGNEARSIGKVKDET